MDFNSVACLFLGHTTFQSSMSDRLLRQHWIVVFAAVCVFAAAYPRPIRCAQPSSLPHLRKQGAATQLIVDGKPFLVLGGELGNSSSSSLEYMRPVGRSNF